jgi:hypothetical protein
MEEQLGPESAFPGRRRLLIWAKRAQRKLFRVLDARSRLICLVVGTPAVVAAAAGTVGVFTTPAAERADPALVAEARRLDLDYPTVASAPYRFAGKHVLWCLIKDMNSGKIVVGGNLSQPVSGAADPGLPPMSTARMGRCRSYLAVIEPATELGVHLRVLGRP